MDNQEPGIADEPAGAARRERLPRACVADARRSMRRFIAEALEELGLTAFECARVGDLDAMLASSRPDLVVVGSSAGGLEACEIMELLAARQFDGKVLVVGARISPIVAAIVGLGQKLGLAMLPLLPTPFADRDVRDRVASLLPGAAPPVPAPGACAPRRTALP
ncbi:MAG: diguanylate phosphodiesterase, partial [Xanthobacteraceae bacterium]